MNDQPQKSWNTSGTISFLLNLLLTSSVLFTIVVGSPLLILLLFFYIPQLIFALIAIFQYRKQPDVYTDKWMAYSSLITAVLGILFLVRIFWSLSHLMN